MIDDVLFKDVCYALERGSDSLTQISRIVTYRRDVTVTPNARTSDESFDLWAMDISVSEDELRVAEHRDHAYVVFRRKIEAANTKWNLDLDEMAYVGDENLGCTGLLNNADAVRLAPLVGMHGTDQKTVEESCVELDHLILSGGEKDDLGVPHPSEDTSILVSVSDYAKLAMQPASNHPARSLLDVLQNDNVYQRLHKRPLPINPCKWLSASQRMVATVTSNVELAASPLQRTPLMLATDRESVRFTVFGRMGRLRVNNPNLLRYVGAP